MNPNQKALDWSKPAPPARALPVDPWACPIPRIAEKTAAALARRDLATINALATELDRLDNGNDSEELFDLFDAQCVLELQLPMDPHDLAMRLARMAADALRHDHDHELARDLKDAALAARRNYGTPAKKAGRKPT